jgi:hypothetical protein
MERIPARPAPRRAFPGNEHDRRRRSLSLARKEVCIPVSATFSTLDQ